MYWKTENVSFGFEIAISRMPDIIIINGLFLAKLNQTISLLIWLNGDLLEVVKSDNCEKLQQRFVSLSVEWLMVQKSK